MGVIVAIIIIIVLIGIFSNSYTGSNYYVKYECMKNGREREGSCDIAIYDSNVNEKELKRILKELHPDKHNFKIITYRRQQRSVCGFTDTTI